MNSINNAAPNSLIIEDLETCHNVNECKYVKELMTRFDMMNEASGCIYEELKNLIKFVESIKTKIELGLKFVANDVVVKSIFKQILVNCEIIERKLGNESNKNS